ncbi:MAG: hypothetical protein ACKVQK_29845 [Burkholderiales bacterium]
MTKNHSSHKQCGTRKYTSANLNKIDNAISKAIGILAVVQGNLEMPWTDQELALSEAIELLDDVLAFKLPHQKRTTEYVTRAYCICKAVLGARCRGNGISERHARNALWAAVDLLEFTQEADVCGCVPVSEFAELRDPDLWSEIDRHGRLTYTAADVMAAVADKQ